MTADRRPLKTREKRWAQALAIALAQRGWTPNGISLLSILFAGLAMLAFIATRWTPNPTVRAACLILAIAGMQLRLLCNLMDGMVAVEAGAGPSKLGELFNDVPDRLADVLIFIGVGICAGGTEGPLLGFGAALGSVLTAYVRVLGKSMGAAAHFVGPMAKPHRMATMSGFCLLGCVMLLSFPNHRYLHVLMAVALGVVCVGCVITCVRRLSLIVRDLKAV